MNVLSSLFAVIVLVLIALLGVTAAGLYTFFGVIVPYIAIVLFISDLALAGLYLEI